MSRLSSRDPESPGRGVSGGPSVPTLGEPRFSTEMSQDTFLDLSNPIRLSPTTLYQSGPELRPVLGPGVGSPPWSASRGTVVKDGVASPALESEVEVPRGGRATPNPLVCRQGTWCVLLSSLSGGVGRHSGPEDRVGGGSPEENSEIPHFLPYRTLS